MKGKIFNAQEVQAIISKQKTMFREVIKLQPQNDKQQFSTRVCSSDRRDIGKHQFINPDDTRDRTELFKCPYQVGQKIKPKPKSGSIDLQLKLFNTELLIKEIRVEKLAEISKGDAYKEGVQRTDEWTGCADDLDFTDAFKFNWNATHKKPKEKFEANPWVWCVSFEIINN